MTLSVRVIPCLDVDNGRVVKGVNFENLRDAGDPVELAARYGQLGADELTFLDVSASKEGRGTLIDVVRRTAEQVFIPLTVGGGVRSAEDVRALLRAGADKVSVNTAAIARPELLRELAEIFGSQCIVLSLDARRTAQQQDWAPSGFEVTTHGGTRSAGLDALEWARTAADLGVGEILLNSMDSDGTEGGFDTELIAAVRAAVNVPVIASGGAGAPEDFPPAVAAGADAVLAASIFHFGKTTIGAVKDALANAGYPIRPVPAAEAEAQPAAASPAECALAPAIASRLKRNADGLVPAVVQSEDGQVLMLAWMDDHALAYTLATRQGTYYSRSRQEYWVKGKTSGNTQEVLGVKLDCDGDTLLVTVRQKGGACHTGDRSCFDADVLL